MSRSRCNAPLGQQRPERSPQGVNVERPAPFVGLVDPSGEQVAVEDSNESGGDDEQRFASKRITTPLEACPLLDNPILQVGGKVRSERDCRALPVLLVCRVQQGEQHLFIEAQLPDRQ